MFVNHTIATATLLVLLSACNDAGFSGSNNSSPKKAATNDAAPESGDEAAPGEGGTADTSADGSQGGGAITTKEDLIKTCENTENLAVVKDLNFPTRTECRFDVAPNLARVDTFLQAVEAQKISVEAPANSVICGVALKSKSATFHYDDIAVFTIENFLVFSTTNVVPTYLEKKNDTFLWEPTKALGKPGAFDAGDYCLGVGSNCMLPPHDQVGAVNVSLDPKVFSDIALGVLGKESLDFTLTIAGDNDDGDCFHSGLDMELTIKYVPAGP